MNKDIFRKFLFPSTRENHIGLGFRQMQDSDPGNGELGDIPTGVLCISYQVFKKLKSKKRKRTKVTPILSDK